MLTRDDAKTTPEILRGAATAVRAGWTQRTRHDSNGNVCALGAIERVFGYRDFETWMPAENIAPDAVMALANAIGLRGEETCEVSAPIANWNNEADQTAENVAQAFDLAAVLVEAAQSTEQPASERCGTTAVEQPVLSTRVSA